MERIGYRLRLMDFRTIIISSILIFVFPNISLAADISGKLGANIVERIKGEEFPGVIVGIIDEQGSRVYGYGEVSLGSELRPNRDTVYEIGSITKTFTAILLADMVNKNELDLNDTVQSFLPDSVKIPQRNDTQITLAHLSTHHSSLPRMPDNNSSENELNPYVDYSVENLYDFLSGYTLTRDIGERGEYSNLGVGLLGHALALNAGVGYEELLSQRILNPLSMDSTSITFNNSMLERLAPAYASENNHLVEVENWDIPTLAGAGAIRSTAEDMLQYLAFNLGLKGSPLESAMKLTHEPRENFGNGNTMIGLGWIIQGSGDNEFLWHNGGTGGYRTFVAFSEQNKRGVVVMTNSSNSPDDIGRHLMNESLPLRKFEPPKERVAITLPTEQLQKLTGSFQLAPEFVLEVTVENDRIYAQATGQGKIELFSESATYFFIKVVDAQVTFELDETGTATNLTLHQNGQNMPAEKIE